MAFILILCHCIVVLFELCIDNNHIQIFFLPATRVSFDGMPVRETYIQIGMALDSFELDSDDCSYRYT